MIRAAVVDHRELDGVHQLGDEGEVLARSSSLFQVRPNTCCIRVHVSFSSTVHFTILASSICLRLVAPDVVAVLRDAEEIIETEHPDHRSIVIHGFPKYELSNPHIGSRVWIGGLKGAEMTETQHNVRILKTTDEALEVEIDGRMLSLPWSELSKRLANAQKVARETIEVSPAGYGLHWPLVDEDLSIEGILRDFG